jgi:hypothetical protein
METIFAGLSHGHYHLGFKREPGSSRTEISVDFGKEQTTFEQRLL